MKRDRMAALWFVLALIVSPTATRADDKKKGDAKANDGIVTNWGKPKDYAEGKVNAFWIWYDDGVWHFRTTGGGKGAHRFNGTIEVVGGKLVGLKGKKGEFGGKNVDQFIFNRTLTAIAFDFRTDEKSDGLNFAVDANATNLKFTLAFDGKAAPKHIRVGKLGDHPAEAVFTAPAHPKDPPDEKSKGKKK